MNSDLLQDKKTSWGVAIFPGSNCDHDGLEALGRILNQNVHELWHADTPTQQLDAILLPGGFSYGDYLRAGAIAKFANVVEYMSEFVQSGKLLIGICNGFQVLTEAGFLPGVLMRNDCLRFVCKEVFIRVETTDTPFTKDLKLYQVLRIPVAHNEGKFYMPIEQINKLEENGQVVFRYCDEKGRITPESNPNGSINNIAGIINEQGNVLGMMPHPERRCDELLGKSDGKGIFSSMIQHINEERLGH